MYSVNAVWFKKRFGLVKYPPPSVVIKPASKPLTCAAHSRCRLMVETLNFYLDSCS